MADPEISETQFVFGYLRELYERRKASSMTLPFGHYFTLPTTVKEKDISADFLINHYSHSEYYQFKRSHSLKHRRGNAEIAANVPLSFLPYYRFKIYNKRTVTKTGVVKLGQYEKLIEIATKNPSDLVYYCAPCFHVEKEFLDLFYKNQIVDNSILINCQQFSTSNFQPPQFDINDGEKHFLVFRRDLNSGFICSQAQVIKVEEIAPAIVDIPQRIDFLNYLRGFSRELLSEGVITNALLINLDQGRLRESILEAVQTIQNYLVTAYDIFWFPLFRTQHG
jgi:hypothetical protein